MQRLPRYLSGRSFSRFDQQNPTNSLSSGQPYIKTTDRQLINYWWPKVFDDDFNLQILARDCPLESRKGYGLIYYYWIKGRICYIGKTRRRSLRVRLNYNHSNGKIGYSDSIKSKLLNAFRAGSLTIKTREVKLDQLNKTEKCEIRTNSCSHRLWNREHVLSYGQMNFWS